MNRFTPNLMLPQIVSAEGDDLPTVKAALQRFIDWLDQRVPELTREQRADLIETLDYAVKPFIK